jgi:hypothetical protein
VARLTAMTHRPAAAAILSACLVFALPAAGGDCAARSGPERASLVELYTSEGCSSCPPADRWFSRVPTSGPGPRVVPLAFHVDYWDSLGWKDRFADPAWSERQREAVRRAGGRTVYTPQVMRDGQGFPRWFSADALAKAAAADSPARARIGLSLSTAPGQFSLVAEVAPLGSLSGTEQVFLAIAESRLASVVRAGENRGEKLSHDHVVRGLVPVGRLGPSGGTFSHAFAVRAEWKPADLAGVAFVQDPRTGEVLQAVRLEACPS